MFTNANSTRLSEIITERNETPVRSSEQLTAESRILIHNTPTPFFNNRSKKTQHGTALREQDQNDHRPSNNNKPSIVPNTPNQINNKRLRKLLKMNGFNEIDELDKTVDSAGEESATTGGGPPPQPLTKKSAMLFKPKSGGADKEPERDGCDLSYETLQKMQRRRNRLVVRRSEVENMDMTESSSRQEQQQQQSVAHSGKLVTSTSRPPPLISLETIDEPMNSQEVVMPSSPILVRRLVPPPPSRPFQQQQQQQHDSRANNKLATPQSASKHNAMPGGSQFTPTMAFTYNESLTKVTRHSFDNSPFNESQQNTKPAERRQEEEEELNEADLDLILLNGLDLNKKTKRFDKMLNELFTQPKTQIDSKKRSMSMDSSGDQSTDSYSLGFRVKSRSNSTLSKSKLTPSQMIMKRVLHISHVDLDSSQVGVLKSTVRELNNANRMSPNKAIKLNSNDSANRSRSGSRSKNSHGTNHHQATVCHLSEKLARNTTHIVLDFNEFFESASIKQVNKKCLLVLAALNQTKIIRYEWIKHSQTKGRWLDESKYLLKSYLEYSSSQLPDEDEFDIQLQRFINTLNEQTCRSFFAAFKNVYIIEPVVADHDDSRQEENMSLGLFKSQNTTYELLMEILIKCGAHLTSRANQAELVVAIDRTNELDDESMYREEIDQERDNFFTSINELKKCVRKREGVAVISSDWIIDSLLKNELLDLAEYQIMRVSRKREDKCK